MFLRVRIDMNSPVHFNDGLHSRSMKWLMIFKKPGIELFYYFFVVIWLTDMDGNKRDGCLPQRMWMFHAFVSDKSSALSTSPAANVLQLNFPISSGTGSSSRASTPTVTLLQASSPALSLPSSSSSLPHSSQIASLPSSLSSPIVNNRLLASNNSNVYKFSTTPGALELLRWAAVRERVKRALPYCWRREKWNASMWPG